LGRKAFALALLPGKEAVIEGGYGWEVRVLADANRAVKVTGISRGPHLYHEPGIIRSGASIIIEFPSVRAVDFRVSPQYYEWSVVPAPEEGQVGRRSPPLPLGWFTMQGRIGWAVKFQVLADAVKVLGVEPGSYRLSADDVRADGLTVSLREPRLSSVFVQAPAEAPPTTRRCTGTSSR